MRTKAFTDLFVGAYGLTRRTGLLKMSWTRRGFVGCAFLYKRLYEDPFWGLVRRNPSLFSGGDVLDLGANIGYTACVFASAIQADSTVYAFEPDPWTYDILNETVSRRDLESRIEPLNLAVGSSEGYLEFWHNKEHSADHRVVTEQFKGAHPDAKDFFPVPVTTVDSFVRSRKLSQISFLKMDVQGYEFSVCQGMRETVERFPEMCVCFEYSPESLREAGSNPADLLEFFRSRRYRFYVLERTTMKVVSDTASIETMMGGAGYVDLLCCKQTID